jgi:uncharacterized protein (UPF0332 family)
MSELIEPKPSKIVDDLIERGQLEKVTADQALAELMLETARGRLRSTQRALDAGDLGECAAPLWDAMRLACSAVLQAEGLRAKGEGHHAITVDAVTEQYGFGTLLRSAKRLRKARGESEYPSTTELVELDADDITKDLEVVTEVVEATGRLLPLVPVYKQK